MTDGIDSCFATIPQDEHTFWSIWDKRWSHCPGVPGHANQTVQDQTVRYSDG